MSFKAESEEIISLDKIKLVPEITQMLRGEPSKAIAIIEGCIHNCRVCEHHSCKNIEPEIATQDSIVEEYRDKYHKAIDLPPLDVQKDTYKLLNGYHRYEALQQLGRKIANVKIWQIEDKDLLYRAYQLNSTQGQKIATYNRNQLIFRMWVKDQKKLEEIAEFFILTPERISQILHSRQLAENFSNLSPLEAKVIHWRKKADKILVIADIEKGMSQVETAHKFGISEGRVSQIWKEHEKELQAKHIEHIFLLSGAEKETSIGLRHFKPPPDIMGEINNGKTPILVFSFKNQEDADAAYKALSHVNAKVHHSLKGEVLMSLLFSAGLLSTSEVVSSKGVKRKKEENSLLLH